MGTYQLCGSGVLIRQSSMPPMELDRVGRLSDWDGEWLSQCETTKGMRGVGYAT